MLSYKSSERRLEINKGKYQNIQTLIKERSAFSSWYVGCSVPSRHHLVRIVFFDGVGGAKVR